MITEIVKNTRVPDFGRLTPDELCGLKKLYESYIKLNTRNGIYFGELNAIGDYAALSEYIQRAKQFVNNAQQTEQPVKRAA